MKKLVLAALLSVVGFVAVTDLMTSFAYAFRCNHCHDRGCGHCHAMKTCAPKCKVCRTEVNEGCMPLQKCEKTVCNTVEACCDIIKEVNISYRCAGCPPGFTEVGGPSNITDGKSYVVDHEQTGKKAHYMKNRMGEEVE